MRIIVIISSNISSGRSLVYNTFVVIGGIKNSYWSVSGLRSPVSGLRSRRKRAGRCRNTWMWTDISGGAHGCGSTWAWTDIGEVAHPRGRTSIPEHIQPPVSAHTHMPAILLAYAHARNPSCRPHIHAFSTCRTYQPSRTTHRTISRTAAQPRIHTHRLAIPFPSTQARNPSRRSTPKPLDTHRVSQPHFAFCFQQLNFLAFSNCGTFHILLFALKRVIFRPTLGRRRIGGFLAWYFGLVLKGFLRPDKSA